MAALVAAKFNIDPIIVLESTFMKWAIRVAAYRYVVAKEEEAARKAKAGSKQPQRF